MKKIFLTLILVLFVIPLGISQDLPSNIPANGLVAYYPFNGNANDESGNSNNGNVLGASLSGDRFGNENSAYSFDGIDDFIVTQNSIASAKQAYTFSFWAKTENGTKNMSAISQNCDDDCDKAYSLVINKFLNSAIECEYGHMGSSPQSFGYAQPAHYGIVNTITSDNVWKNYVLIVGAEDNFLYNNFKFYVNGIQIDTNCNHNWDSWEYDFPNYPMVIGKGNSSIIEGFFNGQLDDVAVWNRALSFNEIKDLYDLPPGILLNGTISAENNQIKNVGYPTDDNDAVTIGYLENIISALESRIDELENNSIENNDVGIPSYIPLDGLLAYYPLDGNGQDMTDFENHMEMVGEVLFANGHEGDEMKSANFTNSIDGYFKLPVSSWTHLNELNAGSLSFWVKLDQKFVSNHYFGFGNSFMVKQKHGVGQDFFVGLSDGTTKVMVYLSGIFPQSSENYIIGNSSLSLDTWYNITVTWNGSNQKLFINGNLDGVLNAGYDGIPDRTDIDYFSIGSSLYGTNTGVDNEVDAGAYGSIDNIAFWSRELSEEEVSNLYSN